jgi:electron transport complex protein RnfB
MKRKFIMKDVYLRLRQRLDEMPNGYPETESGVELKILKKIFSPEDAEMFLKLKLFPETVETIAERLGKSIEEMESILYAMAKKGQIGTLKTGGIQVFMQVPFIVGIYEFQMYRIDKELSELLEEYFPTLIGTLGSYKPELARVVPVNENIEAKSEIRPFEDVRKLLEGAKSFQVYDCLCKKEQALLGNPCSYPSEVCLSFSREENAYEKFSLGGRIITKEETLAILSDAEEQGLVHNVFFNTEGGQFGICNCCPCCCGLFRGIKEFGAHNLLARSNFVARIDVDTCSACGVCADERCPVDAISEEGGTYKVISDKCIGCGVCAVACPTESISLAERPKSEKAEPVKDIVEWFLGRAKNRGIDMKWD